MLECLYDITSGLLASAGYSTHSFFCPPQGDIELVSDLLIGGADVDQVGYASIMPLHLACLAGHAQVCTP